MRTCPPVYCRFLLPQSSLLVGGRGLGPRSVVHLEPTPLRDVLTDSSQLVGPIQVRPAPRPILPCAARSPLSPSASQVSAGLDVVELTEFARLYRKPLSFFVD